MNTEDKIINLRWALAGSLKYDSHYGKYLDVLDTYETAKRQSLWKQVRDGIKIPMMKDSWIGDMYAFWYMDVGLPQNNEEFNRIWNIFFTEPVK